MGRLEVREVRPRELAQLTLIDPRPLLQNKTGVRQLAPLFMNSVFSRFRLLPFPSFAACAKGTYTEAMRAAKKIRYRLEWRKFATKFLPLLSRKA